jgi:hypothetical protein
MRLYFLWLFVGIFSVAALGIASTWLEFFFGFKFRPPLSVELLFIGIPFAIAQFRVNSSEPTLIERQISDLIERVEKYSQFIFNPLLKKVGAVREFKQRDKKPRFDIDRKILRWACYPTAAFLLIVSFLQAKFFAGTYKGFLYPVPPLALAYILVTFDAENFKKKLEKAVRGYVAEEEIDRFLQPFVERGGTISPLCRHENGRSEDIDKFLSMPSGKGFAISVKSVGSKDEKIKVSFDPTRKLLRYRKGRHGHGNFKQDPIREHRERVSRFLDDGLIPSCLSLDLILVFSSHMELAVHADSPVEIINENRFLKFEDVWVVSMQELALLIESLEEGGDTQKRLRRGS